PAARSRSRSRTGRPRRTSLRRAGDRAVRGRSACSARATWAGNESHPSELCRAARAAGMSLSLEVRFALLEESLDPLARILCLRDEQELAVQVMERGAEVHVLLAVQRVASESHGHGRFLGKRLRDLVHRRVQVLMHDNGIYHTVRLQ